MRHDRIESMGSPSMAMLKVLRALVEDGASRHYGLSLIRASGVHGGSLYPILAQLEADAWITGEWEDIDEAAEGRRRRRYYTLTPLGERAAVEALTDAVRRLTPPTTADPQRKRVPQTAASLRRISAPA
jgi:PadR family transcriptional regulator